MNMYAYVGNDPVNRVDPLGLANCRKDGDCQPPKLDGGGGGGGGNAPGTILVNGYPCSIDFFCKAYSAEDIRSFIRNAARELFWLRDLKENENGGTAQEVQCPAVNSGKVGMRTEGQVAMERPGWQVISAAASAYVSFSSAADRFPNLSQHNDAADAWPRFRWSFAMTRSFGAAGAADFANSHEVSNPNGSGKTAMDLYNNAMGREFGYNPDFNKRSPSEAAYLALNSGCLHIDIGE